MRMNQVEQPMESQRAELTAELDALSVYEDTPVGWCAHTEANEIVDEDGHRLSADERRLGHADPRAPRRRLYDDAEVVALRQHLQQHNGLHGLEICDFTEVERATRIFRRDGFVVVRDLLDPERFAQRREGCTRVLRKILEIPAVEGRKYLNESGRLPHRYSYGSSSASRQQLHEPAWASMIDLPATTPILKEIFGSNGYVVVGAGGELCLPGAVEYQHLHSDGRETSPFPSSRVAQGESLGVELERREGSDELHPQTQRMIIECTPPMVTINFLMSDLTWENGPIRQIPGTHACAFPPPTPKDEPEWMRLSTLVGAPAGAGVFRDNRAWHGATPNLSRQVRAMPNVEYAPAWVAEEGEEFRKTMPHDIWETLSPHAQRISRFLKADPGVWPAGAGIMQPLASKRKEVVERESRP